MVWYYAGMEGNEVSIHEVKIYLVLKSRASWMTNREIAIAAKVAPRTARAHSLKLVNLGLLDLAEVFPAHRYKWSDKGSRRNAAYCLRLEKAREVFGLPVSWDGTTEKQAENHEKSTTIGEC